MKIYDDAGTAYFYCPELVKILGGKRFEDLTESERATADGGGHMAWTFQWLAGDWHIDHEANGGIPQCGCGRKLTFIWGDDPHAATVISFYIAGHIGAPITGLDDPRLSTGASGCDCPPGRIHRCARF